MCEPDQHVDQPVVAGQRRGAEVVDLAELAGPFDGQPPPEVQRRQQSAAVRRAAATSRVRRRPSTSISAVGSFSTRRVVGQLEAELAAAVQLAGERPGAAEAGEVARAVHAFHTRSLVAAC